MSDILDMIINGIQQVFEYMASIEFLGTNLLKFTVTVTIIGAILPVLLTLVNNANTNLRSGYKEKRRGHEERKESNDQ